MCPVPALGLYTGGGMVNAKFGAGMQKGTPAPHSS